VIVDSLKDVALGLTEDETGQGVNQAHQFCVAAGVEVCVLHHQRKTGTDGGKPQRLADVYGSRWITAGSGSVVLLWGQAGDAVVEWSHLKQPAEAVGPFKVKHDHRDGASEVLEQADPVAMAERGPVTAKTFAMELFGKESPDRNEVERARRKLERLAGEGELRRIEPSSSGPHQEVTYTVTGRPFGKDQMQNAS
jgi:hypothetical protein